MLQQHRLTPPRLKLYKDGQPLDPSQYLTPAMFGVPRVDAGRLVLSLAQGASLILDDVQEMAPHVRDVMGAFQDALQTDAFANLYAGWHNNKAFSRHWDPQEAIVLQLAGRKRWRVFHPTRPNPLQNDDAPPPTVPPVWEGTLNDGDVLYIPRGWWHEAFPLGEPSLHLTVSLTPPTALDYLGLGDVAPQKPCRAARQPAAGRRRGLAGGHDDEDFGAGHGRAAHSAPGGIPAAVGGQYAAQSTTFICPMRLTNNWPP